jgi:hypothetical protein
MRPSDSIVHHLAGYSDCVVKGEKYNENGNAKDELGQKRGGITSVHGLGDGSQHSAHDFFQPA